MRCGIIGCGTSGCDGSVSTDGFFWRSCCSMSGGNGAEGGSGSSADDGSPLGGVSGAILNLVGDVASLDAPRCHPVSCGHCIVLCIVLCMVLALCAPNGLASLSCSPYPDRPGDPKRSSAKPSDKTTGVFEVARSKTELACNSKLADDPKRGREPSAVSLG